LKSSTSSFFFVSTEITGWLSAKAVSTAALRSVAVWIIGAFLGLTIGLQTELLRLQQFADDRMADFVPELVQFGGRAAQALARPAQRRHRIAARVRLDKRV
jgi:hypothetical protein